jgi:hypothetical protein
MNEVLVFCSLIHLLCISELKKIIYRSIVYLLFYDQIIIAYKNKGRYQDCVLCDVKNIHYFSVNDQILLFHYSMRILFLDHIIVFFHTG